MATTFNRIELKNRASVAYRESGDKSKPNILLLHGYPTSSHMYRNLIPLLSPYFHVVAPDLPGFGFTEAPEGYQYTFESLTDTIELFVEELKLEKFVVYIFDYGSPVGLRLALRKPNSVTAIVSQNGNAYVEGLNDAFWGAIKEYWKTSKDNAKYVSALSSFVRDPKTTSSQYLDGFQEPDKVDPLGYTLDHALITRPGNVEIQVGLFYDYKTNVDLYPKFQEFFRSSNVPVLLVWGKNDIIFPPAGAEAYKRDVKENRLVLLDTGHFALESHVHEIAGEIISYILPKL